MPNYITNVLDVTGSWSQVKLFKKKVSRRNKGKKNSYDPDWIFDFEGTVPMPKSMHIDCPAHTNEEKKIYAENRIKYRAGDWYEFGIKYFGTKWNACNAEQPEEIPDGFRFRFNTAWSPPSQWIEATAKQFPDLKFQDRWIDEGGGAGNIEVWTDGETQISSEEMSDHDWRIEFDSSYAEEFDLVTNGNYAKLIDKYVIKAEEFNYSDHQIAFVKRVKDKDLLLLTGLETLYDEAKELIEERLKGKKEKVCQK
jgi:hypothetical protein